MSEDRNHISVGQWMLLMLLTAIPCVGIVLVFVFAFVGENESRKNYFRALLLWVLIATAAVVAIAMLGGGLAPLLEKLRKLQPK